MAEPAEFAIGARASCWDGSCGEVRRVIIDTDGRTVTHLVIDPGHKHEPARLVPVHLVDAAAGEIRLRCTLAEGHLWGRREVAIPVSAVTRVEDGIRLNLTKKQVEDLPPAG